MNDPVDLAYLNGMYATGTDPWRIETSWYERRKRDLVMGCLPRQRYRAGFEPGCAAGALTERLAERTDELLAADLSEVAVRAAADRVVVLPNVQVQRLLLPEQWPAGLTFDLIVLSEIGYFFAEAGWAELARRVAASLSPDATVLACHWRHDFAERTVSTAALHGHLDVALGLPKQSSLIDADFVLDVWTVQQRSVAEGEGLVG
jgi:SAM-dependent methyltransferase